MNSVILLKIVSWSVEIELYSFSHSGLVLLRICFLVHLVVLCLTANLTKSGSSMNSPSYIMLVVSILPFFLFKAEESILPLFSSKFPSLHLIASMILECSSLFRRAYSFAFCCLHVSLMWRWRSIELAGCWFVHCIPGVRDLISSMVCTCAEGLACVRN